MIEQVRKARAVRPARCPSMANEILGIYAVKRVETAGDLNVHAVNMIARKDQPR